MSGNKSDRLLMYFADPMCSWCWGFSPVIEEIKKRYDDDFRIALILGGLRPWSTEPVTATMRTEILHHWHEVHHRTCQPFNFENAMPEDFVYNTEPPSRAVVTMGEIKPEVVFAYFKAIQSAFYTQQQNVTEQATLLDLAIQFGVDMEAFQASFQSDELKKKTLSHFQKAHLYDVRGFPSLILENSDGKYRLAHGYRTFKQIKPEIETWLA